MANIHPTAVVSPEAHVGRDVSIGPFCVVEPGVQIGDRSRIAARAIIKQNTTLGEDNEVFEGAILGAKAQHLKAGERNGKLIIGHKNIIRENVTMHLAVKEEDATTVGDSNLFMVNAHVAHDCQVANHTILANNVMLGGHVTVQDRAILSGCVGVHQFCRIGKLAMCGGLARVVQDVPPYMMVDGFGGGIVGLNLVGLKRNGFTSKDITELKEAYRVIYRSGMKWSEVLETLKKEFPTGPVDIYHDFLATSKRGFVHERRMPREATIPLPSLDGQEVEEKPLPRQIRIVG